MAIFALTDCNNFYVSCERVFNPRLSGIPVIVLSNNDGNAVARSEEAKAAGVKMGVPVFEIRDIIKRHGIICLSSNYALYADMSSRVMETLSQFTPELEIYSIDEAFLDLTAYRENLTEYGRKIKDTVKRWTGIPVSVGIAETKTLAKMANRIAKKSAKAKGVLDLTDSPYLDLALEKTEVEDIWGIGRQYAKFLREKGIHNALQLKHADDHFIRAKMGVVGIRLLHELRGFSCYPLETNPPAKKTISCSRTFKIPVSRSEDLKEAIASYTAKAAERLREEHSVSGVMIIFLATNRFKQENFYMNSAAIRIPVATSNTSELIRHAHQGLEQIFRKGLHYKKAGIILHEVKPEQMIQIDLFHRHDLKRSQCLMSTLDAINAKIGSGTVKFAAEGLNQNPAWKTEFNMRSPSYTTKWSELPKVFIGDHGNTEGEL